MTDDIQAQYEAFPYPERDPADESKRLITGSPSLPQEMDHHLWGGARDWSTPLRILVAGGGTGDGLIQLCQTLQSAGRRYEATYVDLSTAARKIAEDRVALRGLSDIDFLTDSLMNAPKLGEFDYIDCCGVLHHLPDPQAGFEALAKAMAPGAGLGIMVYAPHGRSGVYPLQAAFGALTQGLAPIEKLRVARDSFERLPKSHPFRLNPNVVDHKASDAGFFDLLLHSSDRPYTITEVSQALNDAGLEMAGVPEPAQYDPSPFVGTAATLDDLTDLECMQLAEDLRGSMKTHVVYAVRAGERKKPPFGHPSAVPRLRGIYAEKLARAVEKSGTLRITSAGEARNLSVPKTSASLIRHIDGRSDLASLCAAAQMDQIAFGAAWTPVERALCPNGLLHYSGV